MHILIEDQQYSYSERRSLAVKPDLDLKLVKNAELSEAVETYLLDHFPLRDLYRKITASTNIYLLQMMDHNGVFYQNGGLYKTEFPLKSDQVKQAAELISMLSVGSLSELNSYYAIIPDKNFYLPDPNISPRFDHGRILEIMKNSTEKSKLIDITSELSVEHYYKTDLHWDQSKLTELAAVLAMEMGNFRNGELPQYEIHDYSPFHGAWHGRWAIGNQADKLTWLSNTQVEEAKVFDHYDGSLHGVYEIDALQRPDAYDLYLNGARPLLTITSKPERSETHNKLYLFRDSFGSSLAPLLLAYYDEIVLIDLRYVSASSLYNLIEFTPGADVLFLYSSMIINDSSMLRR
ncbi:MAG: hypothetical protein GX028_09300 [Clostridiaceae bacterium]|nr:hypothetical protein [Clostridiaceae bacterium]